MTIGERIKQRREELGLTQEELAKKVGYKSRSSINKIELSRDLPLNKISLMAKALETTPSYLVGWTDESEKAKEENRKDFLMQLVKEGDIETLIETLYPKEKADAVQIATAYIKCGITEKNIIRRILGLEER